LLKRADSSAIDTVARLQQGTTSDELVLEVTYERGRTQQLNLGAKPITRIKTLLPSLQFKWLRIERHYSNLEN
jgi:hypothetical protein